MLLMYVYRINYRNECVGVCVIIFRVFRIWRVRWHFLCVPFQLSTFMNYDFHVTLLPMIKRIIVAVIFAVTALFAGLCIFQILHWFHAVFYLWLFKRIMFGPTFFACMRACVCVFRLIWHQTREWPPHQKRYGWH